jgi:IS30 family transposase
MAQMGRPGLSAAQKQELWDRWKSGESLSDIGRALSKHPGSIHGVIAAHGGITPIPRKRAGIGLTLMEREEISRGLVLRYSFRHIAAKLGRAPSTISREVNRNGGAKKYRAAYADEKTWQRALRPKPCRLATLTELREVVANKLKQNWSPEQIAGWLNRKFPDNRNMQISHETIYRTLFVQARGLLKKELVRHLRSNQMMRRSKKASAEGQPRGRIIEGISIRERPADIKDRAIPGHWEGDLITGSKNSHIATLVERQSRFTMLVKIDGKDTHSVVTALGKQIGKLPAELRKSLTWDRGMELARHKELSIATDLKIYFCDPQSPWQRGSNENTNRLLRQYFPKGTDLSGFTQTDLNKVALQLNTRPRKILGFLTPAAKLESNVAPIH